MEVTKHRIQDQHCNDRLDIWQENVSHKGLKPVIHCFRVSGNLHAILFIHLLDMTTRGFVISRNQANPSSNYR